MSAAARPIDEPTIRRLVTGFVEGVDRAGDGPAAREAYRAGFDRLRSRLELYPPRERASATFESAARTARALAADCLPLGIAVAMHLYPLCVLECIPLPWLSFARFQRTRLMRAIRDRALILANAGSERLGGDDHAVRAREDAEGVRIDGTFEYMSLATVADLVLFKARLANRPATVLCAADLRAGSVQIGEWRFAGSMRLSDTCPVSFAGHRIPRGRYVLVEDDAVVGCASDYQRCWFHLFLADIYLARLEQLHRAWGLPRPAERVMSLNELGQLRAYALRLLDEFALGADVQPLKAATSAIKLRVSSLAQATTASLRERAELAPADAERLHADAGELRYIRSQPTADRTILRAIGVVTE